VKVEWKALRLAASTPGYADSAKPVDELIQAAVKARSEARQPIVIWICDAEDDKGNINLEKKIFNDEKVGLAMKRFICLKGEIQTLPDEREAALLARKAPLFYFFDPAGEQFGKTLYGKRASSRSGFCSELEKLWDFSFSTKLKVYHKEMSKLLDRLDKLESEKTRLTSQMDRAADNPPKLAKLKKEEEELKAEEEKLEKEEQEILASVKLSPEFAKGDEQAAK
jgi:hypothetical protein